MRYLRKDESGNGIHLNLNSETGDPCGWKGLDVERQNNFICELKRFGWGLLKDGNIGIVIVVQIPAPFGVNGMSHGEMNIQRNGKTNIKTY